MRSVKRWFESRSVPHAPAHLNPHSFVFNRVSPFEITIVTAKDWHLVKVDPKAGTIGVENIGPHDRLPTMDDTTKGQ